MVSGLHHLTAIAGDAQANVDFYAGVLGLRLVKQTVNYDDPTTRHLYYGDGVGSPGTLLTFFPWPRGGKGQAGVHQVGKLSLAIPLSSLAFWLDRLVAQGVAFKGPVLGAGARVLELNDPDGIRIELVTVAGPPAAVAWEGAPVPAEHAIRGLHAVQLWVLESGPTVGLLERLGYAVAGESGNIVTLRSQGTGAVEVRATGQFLKGRDGVGAVHHVAFTVPDEATQESVRELVAQLGLAPTPVRDRKYFRSVYFREPGGVLFEVATAGPGFTVDESEADLGRALQLPGNFEWYRATLDRELSPLRLPGTTGG